MRSQALRYNAGLIRANGLPFPVADGATSAQLVDRQGNPIGSMKLKRLDSVHMTDWQGRQLLYPAARTNYCGASQNLTAWGYTNTKLSVAQDSTLFGDHVPYCRVTRLDSTSTSASVYVSLRDSSGALLSVTSGTVTLTFAARKGNSGNTYDGVTTCGLYMGGWAANGDGACEVISGPGVIARYSGSIDAIYVISDLSETEDTLIRLTRTVRGTEPSHIPTLYLYPGGTAANPSGVNCLYTRAMATLNDTVQGSYIEVPGINAVTVTDYTNNGDGTLALGQAAVTGQSYDWTGVALR